MCLYKNILNINIDILVKFDEKLVVLILNINVKTYVRLTALINMIL